MNSENSEPRHARAFFGRRKGHKLRKRQAELIETLLPRLALDLSHPAPAELGVLFPVPVSGVALEIGFGAGENMVAQAVAQPGKGIAGDDLVKDCVSNAVEELRQRDVPAAELGARDG